MTVEHRFNLIHLLTEHYNIRDDRDFSEKTKAYYLPQYRSLETKLKEGGEWFEKRDEIVQVLRDTLGCSEEEAIEYIRFYDEVTQSR